MTPDQHAMKASEYLLRSPLSSKEYAPLVAAIRALTHAVLSLRSDNASDDGSDDAPETHQRL